MQPRAFSANDFELLNVERTGGMSKVRKAKLLETGEICALKYAKRGSTDEETTASFNREAAALLDIDHKNVVRMLGIGTDGTDRFLALEWLEETLDERISSFGPTNWQTFYELVGRPLLDGIRYAHNRGYAHRDLKPLNVMFTRLGVPKITDFGIARNLDDVRIGLTFARTGSPPWTPAEVDDAMNSECRDLYSWAALCIACLTGRLDYKSATDLRSAAGRLASTAPSDILLNCLADEPAKRPAAATAMLWELDDFHRKRLDEIEAERWIGVEVSPNAHQKLEELAGVTVAIEDRISQLFSDFRLPCQICSLGDGDLEFTGQTYCVKAGRSSLDSPWLVIKDLWPATQHPASAQGIRAAIRFVERFDSSVDPTQSRGNVTFVETFLDAYSARDQEEQKRRDEERYLNMLQDVLASRMRALRHLPALEYSDGKWEGDEFAAVIDSEELPITGEQRIVRGNAGILVFEVTRLNIGRVFLRPLGVRRGQPPTSGLLQVDTVAQRRSLERQEEALKTLRSDLAVSPALKRIILKPSTADHPERGGRPAEENLSPDKTAVLDAALGLRQVMVVRGPPGTGKTKLITAVVTRYLHENPKARVLIAAQTHIAIDHVIEKLLSAAQPVGRIVRIARADEEKVAPNVRPALLQHCLLEWCEATATRSREYMRRLGKEVGFDSAEVELSIRLEALLHACEQQNKVHEDLEKGQQVLSAAQTEALASPLTEMKEVETATVATLTVAELQEQYQRLDEQVIRLRQELQTLSKDGASLSDLTEQELRDWTGILGRTDPQWLKFRKQLELQVTWLDLLGQLKQFEEIVLRSASVVAGTCVGLGSNDAFGKTRFDLCVIDEASKATATEALIPMVRSERCLIVGDPHQLPPFERDLPDIDGYADGEVRETLLDYLIPRLPKECIYELTHQHRMCEGIGELISHAFYDKALANKRPDAARALWLRKRFAKPILWMDTAGWQDSRQGHSFVNRKEQEIILDLLNQFQHDAGRSKARASVAVIAGYAAQAHALDGRIGRGSFTALDIEVATVDSFQGRESDICIFSITLSNSRDYLGFLRSVERLNVALSRPRDLLVIVGDQTFCYAVPGNNPFTKVIDFMEQHPTKCETRYAGQ